MQLLPAAVVLLSLLLLVRCQDFAEEGPCSSTVTTLPFTLPAESDCGWRCSGVLYIHTPAQANPAATADSAGSIINAAAAAAADKSGSTSAYAAAGSNGAKAVSAQPITHAGGGACPFLAPYPTITFISGFLASAVDYFSYSRHLASWGFAVLQYDFNLLGGHAGNNGWLHTDAAEAGFLVHFLAMLKAAVSDPSSELYGKLDLTNLGAAGHSRGGKIAALHYAGFTPSISMRAAFLVDPVDGTTSTATQPGYPSAVELLRGMNKTLGVTGAGRLGPCNSGPDATGNWSSFWGVSAGGSWLEVVPDAGHLQFAHISSLLDLVCCRGCRGLVSHKEGMALAVVPMTAWFHRQLRPVTQRHYNARHNSHTSGPPSIGAKSWQGAKQNEVVGTSRKIMRSSIDSSSSSGSGGVSAVSGRFRDWVCEEEAAGRIQFSVKGRGDVCGPERLD